jgi:hypothetical protein
LAFDVFVLRRLRPGDVFATRQFLEAQHAQAALQTQAQLARSLTT